MSEHKPDLFTATGSHRAWVGERPLHDKPTEAVNPNAIRHTVPVREAAHTWINRPQLPTNTRHAAITKNLSHFNSYKSWADKVKSDWKKDGKE